MFDYKQTFRERVHYLQGNIGPTKISNNSNTDSQQFFHKFNVFIGYVHKYVAHILVEHYVSAIRASN